jgi:hypothetical protein
MTTTAGSAHPLILGHGLAPAGPLNHMCMQVAEGLSDIDRALLLLEGSHCAQQRAVIDRCACT